MRIHGNLTINGRLYRKGYWVPASSVYPFFIIHMLLFGGSAFLVAYFAPKIPIVMVYAFGGIAIPVYIAFYLTIFGRDTIKWLFINSALGIYGVMVEMDLLLNQFGKSIYDYPFKVHVVPVIYFILYTFLIRQAFLDVFGVDDDEMKKQRAEKYYVAITLIIYSITFVYKQLY